MLAMRLRSVCASAHIHEHPLGQLHVGAGLLSSENSDAAALINEIDATCGCTALHLVLRCPEAPLDALQLVLHAGADLALTDKAGVSGADLIMDLPPSVKLPALGVLDAKQADAKLSSGMSLLEAAQVCASTRLCIPPTCGV